MNNPKYFHDSSRSTSALRHFSAALCLMILPLNLIIFVTGTASANSGRLVEYKLLQDGTSDSNNVSGQLKRQLLRSVIEPFADEKDMKSSTELNRLIKQIRAIEFAPKEKIPERITITEQVPVIEPNEVPAVALAAKDKQEKEIETKPPHTPITGETLQLLAKLSKNPEKISNPFELGEVLFINGNLKEASVYYQEALKRTDPNDPNSAMDRAWLLFQTGNCHRNDDMTAAANFYRRLITEYPNSFWADLAQIQSQLIDWYQKDEPQKLIDENKEKYFAREN